MSNKENMRIKEFLKFNKINIIGFASAEDNIPKISEDFSPRKILKEAQSIICFAIPIPRGVLYSDSYDTLLFWRYCNITYRHLDNVANSLSLHLEDQGYISTPINSCFPWKIINYEFWGFLPLVFWAEKAGLGNLTKCGLLGNSQYGTRLLLGGVLTSKLFKISENINQAICPKECFECIEKCPVKAIERSGKINHDLCMRTANKNPIISLLVKDMELRKSIDFETIINTVGVDDHAAYICIECLKACPFNK